MSSHYREKCCWDDKNSEVKKSHPALPIRASEERAAQLGA